MLRDDDGLAPPQPALSPRQGEDWSARAQETRQLAREKRIVRPPESREPRPTDDEPKRAEQQDSVGKPSGRDEDATDDKAGPKTGGGVRGFIRAHPLGLGIGAVILLAAVVAAVLWYMQARHFETTDDAFIDGRAFALAPKVGGYVTDVLVTDNQHVKAGDPIARIDERDYRVSLEQAEAQVQAALANVKSYEAQIAAQGAQIEEARAQVAQTQAALDFAGLEQQRAQDLAQKGSGTVQQAQQTASNVVQGRANLARAQATLNAAERQVAVLKAQQAGAAASLAQAQAQYDQARLNLSYTTVTAAQGGRVVRLTGAKGQLAQAGTALAMFVPDAMWVTANFKETQLTDMRPGQPVTLRIDAYPGRDLRGHVESVQPGSGTVFSLLPAQNATGNYVKVVQRVPVKLVFDELPDDVAIGPGMSVVPSVRVR